MVAHAPWLRAQIVYKNPWLRIWKMEEFAAKREPPSEGKDLLDVDCINFKHHMVLPMSYIDTLLQPHLPFN